MLLMTCSRRLAPMMMPSREEKIIIKTRSRRNTNGPLEQVTSALRLHERVMAKPAEGSTDQANFILAIAFVEGFAHESYAIEHRLAPESVLVSVSSREKVFLHLREPCTLDWANPHALDQVPSSKKRPAPDFSRSSNWCRPDSSPPAS